MTQQSEIFKKVISHAKEYGFIFPSSEIYDGLSAVYDYGQNGAALKNNIRQYWWKAMVQLNENIVGIDASILMHPTTWKASGHVDAFNDPLIDNKDSKKRYRADVLVEDYVAKIEGKIEKEIAKASKRFGVCNIVDKNARVSTTIKCHPQTLEPLLSSSIPNLHGDQFVIYHDLFSQEIGTNSCFVLICKFLVYKLLHQRSFSSATVPHNNNF